MMGNEITRFLLAGGFAAAINWLARMALSFVLPLESATLVAYSIGMFAGFFLYRHLVFRRATGSIGQQVMLFLAVNALGAVVVLAATLGLKALIGLVVPGLTPFIVETLAHGLAIGIGAVSNYLGHRALTFGLGEARLSGQSR
jgi:energy-coupling factor transport system substrate-specific component